MRQRFAWLVWIVIVGGLSSEAAAQAVISQPTAARLGLTRQWYSQVGAPRATGSIIHMHLNGALLLVQSKQGMLTALDAETGRKLWATQVGPENRHCTEPAANEKFVVVVNGTVLYVLDRATGNLLWQRPLGGAPGAGPAVTATHAFVPMLNGRIEGLDLELGAKQTPWSYKSAGRVQISPLATSRSVSWATESGYFYVADPAAKGIRYRLETRNSIHSSPASWPPRLYACSSDGVVYAVDEDKGYIDWRFTAGEALYTAPAAVADKVFAVSEFNNLYCLDGNTGDPLWSASAIKQFVSLSPTRVYAIDTLDRLAVLDARSGARLGALPLPGITLKLLNPRSDRIFLANEACVVQCLRESDLRAPVLYVPPTAEDATKPKLKPKPRAKPAELDEFGGEPPADESAEEMSAEEMPAEDAGDGGADAAGDEADPFKE